MTPQREMNNMKRHLNSSTNDANEPLQESKSMEVNKINIGILLGCKESIAEQLTNYDKQLNECIDSLEENEENDKNIENYENIINTGKRV